MCSYHGGKQRIGKRLSSIIADQSLDIEDEYDFKIKGYCEPFCGMLGVYKHIPDLFDDHKPKLKYKLSQYNFQQWERQFTFDGMRNLRYGQSFCDYFNFTDNILYYDTLQQRARDYILKNYVHSC